MLGLALLIRVANRRDGVVALVKRLAIDILAIVGSAALAFAPYWNSGKLPAAIARTQRSLYFDKALHVNPLWVWAFPRISDRLAVSGINRHFSAASRLVVVALVLAGIVGVIMACVQGGLTGPVMSRSAGADPPPDAAPGGGHEGGTQQLSLL